MISLYTDWHYHIDRDTHFTQVHAHLKKIKSSIHADTDTDYEHVLDIDTRGVMGRFCSAPVVYQL